MNVRIPGVLGLLALIFAACTNPVPPPAAQSPAAPVQTPAPPPAPTPPGPINLDAATQTLIAHSDRVAFLIPFSHWDTDWHESYPDYVLRSDGNILAAIQLAKQYPRFRFALEQILFVQHFWDNHPEARADLVAAVQRHQITFAWAGITQPETSLVAPAVQIRNLQMGEDWIAQMFGSEFVPHTAWQSDAFGTSAIFPAFLAQAHIPYLYIGRGPQRCDPSDASCKPLPQLFYWTSPAAGARVLVANVFYPGAWDATHRIENDAEQIASLAKVVEAQFARANTKYIFVPMGSDFIDPDPYWVNLVDRWNAGNQRTVLVMADPATAFQYAGTQPLLEVNADLNPIWQAFYATRPEAKIADKQSAYYLTANDKFGALAAAPADAPVSSAWLTATLNAHYDNIAGVSFDNVWESTQRPRFEQTVNTAAADLAATLARIASGVSAPVGTSAPVGASAPALGALALAFNPSSWQRSEVVEIADASFDARGVANTQRINVNTVAVYAPAVPSVGYSPLGPADPPAPPNPTAASQTGNRITLTNGLVSVTVDGARGGTLASLALSNREFVSGLGDDLTFIDDHGDVYGSTFGQIRARSSDQPAQMQILAQGPLVARAQAVLSIQGQPMTKTVSLRANSPRVDVTLEARALPGTTALVQMPTTISATVRTDDLGFASFAHEIDARPIISGDITYRRKIFYPTTAWTDVSAKDAGLALLTQGLQGIAGASTLDFMLVRDVTERSEGVTDRELHTFRYAYLPHTGPVPDLMQAAYEFNEPLIPVWRTNGQISVRIPFEERTRELPVVANAKKLPDTFSLLSAESGIVADLFSRGGGVNALVLDNDRATPATIRAARTITLAQNPPFLIPIELFK